MFSWGLSTSLYIYIILFVWWPALMQFAWNRTTSWHSCHVLSVHCSINAWLLLSWRLKGHLHLIEGHIFLAFNLLSANTCCKVCLCHTYCMQCMFFFLFLFLETWNKHLCSLWETLKHPTPWELQCNDIPQNHTRNHTGRGDWGERRFCSSTLWSTSGE